MEMPASTTPIDTAASASSTFERLYGSPPAGVWSAPGRVNLIGEHTDYNGGLVLPFAIDLRAACALGDRADDTVTAYTTTGDEPASVSLSSLDPDAMSGWSAYVLGVVWALSDAGADVSSRRGVDLVISSAVPVGAGVSSSAAIECAVALALNDHWSLGFSRAELVTVCQLAENRAVGARTGTMDQTASLMGVAGSGVLLDCATSEATLVPLDFAAAGLSVLAVDTRVRHDHAAGGYGERRDACERAAKALGVGFLSELGVPDLDNARAVLDDDTYKRVKHIVTENARVRETASLLAGSGPASLGPVLSASHASMRDDFEISVPELDLAVDVAVRHGALGARMTGGGFGGTAIALVPQALGTTVADAVVAEFAAADFAPPATFFVEPADGARRDT